MTPRTALLAVVLVAVHGVGATDPPAPAAPCDRWAHPPQRVGTTPAALRELSGLVASHRHPGVFWGHNDSDNDFELVGIRPDGAVVATYAIADASAVDVEDIARGPCTDDATTTCLYLADIGDNLEARASVQVFEVPEPNALGTGRLSGRRLPFTYADGAHNAETLLVDAAGRMWVVTKRLDDLGRLYRVEGLGAGRVGVARWVRRLRAPRGFGALTTAGDLHPTAGRVLLRTYTDVWEFRGAATDDVAAILGTTPVQVPGPRQPQGEAIAYTATGRGYLVGSEKTGAPIYRVHCMPDAP